MKHFLDHTRRYVAMSNSAATTDQILRAQIAPPIVQQALHDPGQVLDTTTRAQMEPRFGRDLSGVRVHTGGRAAESARAVGALAYTVGQQIVFNTGQYAPQTTAGRHLLAHELAHTVQQGGAVDAPFEPAERAAEAAADSITSGQHVPPARLQTSAPTLALAPADPRVGGTVSRTKPAYGIADLRRRLASYNLGPIKGSELISQLDNDGWSIMFWKDRGKVGEADPNAKLILLSPDNSLLSNVSTLFHEGIHATRPVPNSTGDPRDPERVWNNIEDEVNAQYQELLFLQAHAADEALFNASAYAYDKERIIKMDQRGFFEYFRDEQLPLIILGKCMMGWQYNAVLKTFNNDIGAMARSPRAIALLKRVIFAQKPALKMPRPARPKFESLIKPRTDFRREVLKSVEDL